MDLHHLQVDYTDTPFLWITDGDNNADAIPDPLDEWMLIAADFAVSARTIGAALFQVPNQPVEFAGDPLGKRRSEDAIIAFTWWKWITDPNANPEWLVHLPMAKAAVKAMDTIILRH